MPDDRDTDEPSAPPKKYWAFISYSSKDKKYARWLHSRLENYAIPKEFRGTELFETVLGKHLRPVFRDREELSGSSKLVPALDEALAESRYLIVLCSKSSAQSVWVNKEIESFKKLGGEKHILALIIDGEPNATSSDEIEDSEECFPPALRYPEEPLAGDLRKEGDGKERGFLKVLAGLVQVDFDHLFRRHERAQKRKRWIIGSVAMAVIVALTGLSVFAFYKEGEARRERNKAETAREHEQLAREEEERARIKASARDLASQAHLEYQRDPAALSRSVLLAVESTRLEPSAAATEILRKGASLLAKPVHRFPHGGSIYNTLFSGDGSAMATLASDGVRVWDIDSGREQLRIPAIVKDVKITGGGKKVAVAGVNGWGLWDGRTGECLHAANFESAARHVTISADTSYVAAVALDQQLRIMETATGKVLRQIRLTGAPVGLLFIGEVLVMAIGRQLAFYEPDGDAGADSLEFGSRIDEIEISEHGHLAAACGLEVEIVDVTTRQRVASLSARSAFTNRVHDLAFDPQGGHLAVATDLETRVFRLSDGEVIRTIDRPADRVLIDVEHSRLATSRSGRLKEWNVQNGEEVKSNESLARLSKEMKRGEGKSPIPFKSGWVTDFQFGPRSSYVAALVDQGTLLRWPLDADSSEQHQTTVRSVTFDSRKQFVAQVFPSGWVQSTVSPAEPDPDVEDDEVEVGFRHHLTFRFGQGVTKFESDNLVITESVPGGSFPPPAGNPGSSPSAPGDLPKHAWMPEKRPRHETTLSWARSDGDWEGSPVDQGQGQADEAKESAPERYGFLRESGGVWVRDNEEGEFALRLGADGEVAAARLLGGGDSVIVSKYSPAVSVWNIEAKRETARAVHESLVNRIDALQSADRFAAATVDGEVWLWGVPGDGAIATLNEGDDTYTHLPWLLPKFESYEGESTESQRARILRAIKVQQRVLERMVQEVRFSADGMELFAYALRGGRWLEHLENTPAIEARLTAIAAWDTGTWQQSGKPPRWEAAGNRWCDADAIYSSSGERFPYPKPGEAFRETFGESRVSNRIYSADGSKLAVLRRSTELRAKKGNTLIQFVDSDTGAVIHESEFQGRGSEWVSHIRSADGNLRYLLIGGDESGLWDMDKHERVYDASAGVVAPSGAFFIASDRQGTEVVALPSLERRMYIKGHLEPAIGPNERWLCFYRSNARFGKGLVKFVDLENPSSSTWEIPLENQVETVAFDPGGRYLALAEGTVRQANDNEEQHCFVRVYDLEKRSETIRFAISSPALSLAFSPVSDEVAAGLRNGLVKVWIWRPEAWADMATHNLTRNLTEDEWVTFFPDTPFRKTVEGLP